MLGDVEVLPEPLPVLPPPAVREAADGADPIEEAEATDAFGALALITHLDVGIRHKEMVDRARHLRGPGKPAIHPIATRIGSWAELDACAARGLDAFVWGKEAIVAEMKPGAALQPESMLIIRVMQMIQRNEDVRAIEAALVNDHALTARLLHLAFSAAGDEHQGEQPRLRDQEGHHAWPLRDGGGAGRRCGEHPRTRC